MEGDTEDTETRLGTCLPTWSGIIQVDESNMNKENIITNQQFQTFTESRQTEGGITKIDINAIKLKKRYISC